MAERNAEYMQIEMNANLSAHNTADLEIYISLSAWCVVIIE